MLSFIIGLLVGAALGCIAGFMLCSWVSMGRINDEAREMAIAEYLDLIKAIDNE